jgi:VCBS repeat protein
VLFPAVFGSPVSAQTNPIPFVNYPTVPEATPPGGPAFTLTVNGAGFANGAIVRWNGQARVTTFVSTTQVKAAILASDVATANLASITVSNPSPGGGTSNLVLFSVTTPENPLAFTRTDGWFTNNTNLLESVSDPTSLVASSSPMDGSPILAVANGKCSAFASCVLDLGTFESLGESGYNGYDVAPSAQSLVAGDFNGDGVLDFVILGKSTNSLPGLVDGSVGFTPPTGWAALPAPVVGDFNRDGHLDLVIAGTSALYFLPGNGDETFGTAIPTGTESATEGGLVAGDFNGDGILDLAVTNPLLNTVSILLGNGDGTFKAPIDYITGSFPASLVTGDLNGDGKLDLAVLDGMGRNVSILLGNGDGTFKPKVDSPAGVSIGSLALGDFNGDGILDITVSDTQCTSSGCPPTGSVNILLGDGDGTFQSPQTFAAGGQPDYVVATGETTSQSPTGIANIAVANVADNTVSVFSSQGQQTGPPNPVPSISQISPAYSVVAINTGTFTLTVNGANFVPTSTISFGGLKETTTFISSTQLTAIIQNFSIDAVGAVTVFISNPAPGGGDSPGVAFNVLLPPPEIYMLAPNSVLAGSPGFTMVIDGANFVSGSTVNINNVPRTTTFISNSNIPALSTSILASDVANPGTVQVSVTNPLDINFGGGGNSGNTPLTVLPANSQPTISSLDPASAAAGGTSFSLEITGTAFGPSSVVTFGGKTVASTNINPNVLTASIPASAIALAGTPQVTVANPGSGPSVAASFAVQNPIPLLGSLSPTSVPAGNASLSLSIAGFSFVQGSLAQVNGSARPTTYVSANALTATLPATDFTHSGTLSITVNNLGPGGGVSGTLPLIVTDFNVIALAPTQAVTAGQPADYSLTLAAVNGTLGATVSFSATGLPAGATATFTPPNVPAGSAGTTVMLSIATTPHTSSGAFKFPRSRWPFVPSAYGLATAIGMMWLGICTLRVMVKNLAPRLVIVLLLALTAGLAACGSGASSAVSQVNPATGTPAGTYTITVNATSGNAKVSTAVTLTVM